MKMKIAIVDDQQKELARLYDFLKAELPSASYFSFSCGEDFLKTWQAGAYDLICLDMYMDGILGIDVARVVRETDPDIRLVFCTTSNEFASESYEVGANYYLHKPISESGVKKMLQMIRLEDYEISRFLRFADGQRVVLRNILYTEYYNHTIIIHCKNQEEVQTRMSQTEWETILSEFSYFYSCSKGIVVNFYEVVKPQDGIFLMSDGSQVTISRRKSKDSLEAYASFRFELMRKEMQ